MILKNPVILLTRKLPDLIEKKLSKKYSVIRNKSYKRFSYKELKKKIENVDILVPCISDTIDASIIKAAKLGDAAILKELMKILNENKIKVIKSNFFNPELTLSKGIYTIFKPNKSNE